MAAPKGNQNAKGKKTGRKSAYQEKADAEFLWDIFLKKYTVEEIKAKLKKGKFSIKDVWISKLVGGNERMLNQLIRKLFPDQKNVELSGEIGILNAKELARLKNIRRKRQRRNSK